MAESLALALMSSGAVRPDQMEAALKLQKQRGGHVGSALVELGVMRRGEVLQALGRLHGLPPAPPSRVRNPDPSLSDGADRELLWSLRAVPFDRTLRALCVAFADPEAADRGDELGTAVRAYVALDTDVEEGLGVLFGADWLMSRRSMNEMSLAGNRYGQQIKREVAVSHATGLDSQKTAVVSLAQIQAFARAKTGKFDASEISPSTVGPSGETGFLQLPPGLPSVPEVADRLFAAQNEAGIAQALLDHFSACFARVMLLAHSGSQLRGLAGRRVKKSNLDVFSLRLPGALAPTASEPRYGPPARNPMLDPLHAVLGGAPRIALWMLVPTQRGELWVIYADHDQGSHHFESLHDFEAVCREAAAAFDVLRGGR